MTKKRSVRYYVQTLLASALALIAMWLLFGFVLSFGWHMLHQTIVSYAGWRIPVPKHYFVMHDRNGPSIWTLSPGAPIFNLPYGRISFYQAEPGSQFSKAKDYLGFVEGVRKAAAQSGHQFKSTQTISRGEKSAYCVEFTREPKQPRSLIRCAVDDSNVFVFYEGDSRYFPDVVSVIQTMSPEPRP